MKVDKNQLIIDVRSIDQPSFEALVDFADEYKNLPIGKLVQEWIGYEAGDGAAWYSGDDLEINL